MSELFLSILNMSLTASYVIIFIMLIRLPLKKAPKFISYALWGVAAFRLIIPFSFESMFSLMPRNTNGASIPRDIIYQQSPQINSGIEAVDSFVGHLLPAPAAGVSVNPLQIYAEIGAYIWVLGILALLVYSFVSIYILKKQLKGSKLIEGNIYEAKNLKTPFVLGVIKPNIYLPAVINDEERDYILLHEQTHVQRKDHVIKILAFFVLSIHWFNPFVWIAFILMSRDMELSCDERVLKEMNEDVKKPYANSLLSLATGRHVLSGSPLAFSEGNIKGRIKNVLNYKKPKFWVIVISIIIVTSVGIGLMANPMNTAKLSDTSDIYAISEKWAEALKHRDGKARYELMAPESKKDYYDSLIEINGDIEYPWVIGWSSPYVASYDIKISGASAVITYITKYQSEPDEYIYKEQLFFSNQGEKTFVSKYNVIVSFGGPDRTETQGNIGKSYDRISEYMKEKSTATFSPYYELLDFQISKYEEKIVDGNVEATFFYKIIEKNYDKDPDSVGFIKEAKESGNKNYQQMYDEYLQPRESNFDLKIIIDKDDVITLYSNVSPNGIEWEETKMTDYIIKD